MPAESFRVASKSLELFIPRKETGPLERGTEGHDTDAAAAQEFEKRFLRPALVGQHALEAGAEIGVDPALQLENSDGVRHGATVYHPKRADPVEERLRAIRLQRRER